ncbi:MAG: pyrroline-5-carboxylate reductase family protein, partial [Actinomyces sp.]
MRIGFIGAGNMVSAIVRGAVAAGTPAGHLLLTSKHGSAERLAGQVGAVHVPDADDLVSRSDVLIVGLKPYVIPDVLPRLSEAIAASHPLVVSIAAGVPLERLESMLPGGTRVVRTMPNMAASVGESMTALAPGSSASAEDLETVRTLMETIGRTVVLEEKDF